MEWINIWAMIQVIGSIVIFIIFMILLIIVFIGDKK
jgi:hypothetical protein